MKKILMILAILGGFTIYSCDSPQNEDKDDHDIEIKGDIDDGDVDVKHDKEKTKIDINAKDKEGGFENKDVDINIGDDDNKSN